AGIAEIGRWAKADQKAVAAAFAPLVGIPAPILEVAIARQEFDVKPITPTVVAEQQAVADAFFKLGLIPKAIQVADAVRKTD
ncbi:ABC transporter substrate-binding protein, partial [Salmonella enterica]